MKTTISNPGNYPEGTTIQSFFEAAAANYGLNLAGHPFLDEITINILLRHAEIFAAGQLKTMLENTENAERYRHLHRYLGQRQEWLKATLERLETEQNRLYNEEVQ
jgi:hypothetical protein